MRVVNTCKHHVVCNKTQFYFFTFFPEDINCLISSICFKMSCIHIDGTCVHDQIIVANNKIEKVNPNPKNKDSIIANP